MPTKVIYLDVWQELPSAAVVTEEDLWQRGVRPGAPPVVAPPPWLQDQEPGNLFGVPEDDRWNLRALPSLPLPILPRLWAFDGSDTAAPAAAIAEEDTWQNRVAPAQSRPTWPLPWQFDAEITSAAAPSLIEDTGSGIPCPIAPARSVPPGGIPEWLRQDGGTTTPPLGPFCLLLTAVPSPKLRITLTTPAMELAESEIVMTLVPTTPVMTLTESGPKMTLTKVEC